MEPTRSNYYALSYCVPFLSLIVIFTFLSFLNRRASTFIHRSILGVELDLQSSSNANDSTIKSFFFVPIDDEEIRRAPPLKCWTRIIADIVCSIILGVFVAILFQSLVLSFESVPEGGNCPSFTSDCFPAGVNTQRTNYTCEQNNKANFSSGHRVYYCFGFVYNVVSAREVIDSVGICGGLMGVISSIVPLVYYLTRYKACLGLSFSCILIPLIIIIITTVIATADYVGPAGLSTLAWIIFALLLLMTLIAWIWGFVKSWRETNNYVICIETCPFCCCFEKKERVPISPITEKKTENLDSNKENSSSLTENCCTKQYVYYPFCLLALCGCEWRPFGKVHEV